MGAKILETVRSLGMRLRGWLPRFKRKTEPRNAFYVVPDDLPDDQPALACTFFHVDTCLETNSHCKDVTMIPPDQRMRYSEYRRIREEHLRKMEEQARQQDRVE